ncbi:MAG: DUF938 domain-containing protein [Henriciella sp.]|nr:DUF938 domain-containing protein [Henriciella sp.]
MSASGDDANDPKSETGQPVALEPRTMAGDGRRYSPSTGRNKDAVRQVFLDHVLTAGNVLEIASGTGEHGVHITQAAPDLHWTYSDIDPDGRASQAAWRGVVEHDRLKGPLIIDTTVADWSQAHVTAGFDAIFCANMIHIAPFAAATGLLRGASALLPVQGRLVLYGPFARRGEMAPSNARFSDDLKRRDPAWGVRDLDLEIEPVATEVGFTLRQVIEMPANNLTVVFERR